MLSKFCCFLAICCLFVWISDFCNETTTAENEATPRKLARSKRYLVFPEGSSLQLVFCLQTSALIAIGDIFLFANTLALAWTLPTDPKLLLMFKEYEKTAQRRGDDKNMYYVNEEGKILAKVPFKRKDIIKPVFTKRSINKKVTFKEKLKIKIDREKMHERKLSRDFLKKDHLDHDSINFHRSSRIGIYAKLMPLFSAMGGDGRQCVLYKLCQSAKFARQGTFLQELLRVVFTLPKGKQFDEEDHKDYDNAHKPTDDCTTSYPGCDINMK